MWVIDITGPTPPKAWEVTNLKVEDEKASPQNKEVELNDEDLTTRIVIV